MHLHYTKRPSLHSGITDRARYNVQKMFTPPKSKSPWEAMTSGSTGGWAGFAGPSNPTNPNDPKGWGWVGPAITTALGAVPGFGPLLSAGMGGIGASGMGGFQGTDKGMSNLWSTPLGALGGYGLGGLGAGAGSAISSGLKGGLGAMGGGFGSGISKYFGTNIIPGLAGSNPTAWLGGANAIPTSYGSMMQPLYGGSAALTGTASGGATSVMNQFTPATANYLARLQGSMGSGSAYSPSNLTASNMTGSVPSTLTNVAGGGGAGGAGQAGTLLTAGQEAAKKGLFANMFDNINPYQVIGGGALSALPMFGSKTPEIPQSELYGKLSSRLLGERGISELGQMGREQLKGQLMNEFSPVPDEYYNASTRRLDEAYDKAEQDFRKEFKGLRPGANVENDAYFQQGINKIRQDRAREKAGLGAELDYRREADYYTRKANDIKTALGVDDQTFSDYLSLAQLDTERLAANAGISMGEAQKFKDIFGQIGGYFMQRGMGLDPNATLTRMLSLGR